MALEKVEDTVGDARDVGDLLYVGVTQADGEREGGGVLEMDMVGEIVLVFAGLLDGDWERVA